MLHPDVIQPECCDRELQQACDVCLNKWSSVRQDSHTSTMQSINCVKGEIHNVLAVLRLSARSRNLEAVEDDPLVRRFSELHEMLETYNGGRLKPICTVVGFCCVAASTSCQQA